MTRCFFYLLGIMLLLTTAITAQRPKVSYNFAHLNISKGLASNHVSAILQDRKGFIWIASTALQRYDGTNLVTIANFDRVPGSIYYDDICLCEDRQGRIWMGTPDNIRVYDPVTALVRILPIDNSIARPEGLKCSQIIQDHDGVIWATTYDGLLRYDEKAGSFKKALMIPEAIRSDMKDAIMEDENGNLWISGAHELYILDRERQQFFSASHNPKKLPVLHIRNSFNKIITDNRHRIWLAGRSGQLYCYNPTARDLHTYTFHTTPAKRKPDDDINDAIFDVSMDGENQVWVATEKSGIFRFNETTQSFDVNITAENEDEQGLHYDYEANCFLSDREGHLWIGTDRGVNILNLHNNSFRIFDHRSTFSGTSERLPVAEVTGIYQASDGAVYVGYWGRGFSRLSPQLNLVRNYIHHEGHERTTLPEERGLVWSFSELKDGTILVGQENGHLSLFNPATGYFTKHLTAPELCEQTLLHLQPYNDSLVWIGLYKRGLASWNPQRNTFRYYHELTDALNKPVSVMDMIPEGDSLLWLGTSGGGLIGFDTRTYRLTSQTAFKLEKSLYNNITCLLKYNDSTILVGTDHGLWVFNTRNHHYRPLQINNHLFDGWILSMAEDVPGKIWFTTLYGFYRYDLPQDDLETFVQGDLIIDNTRRVRRRIVKLQNGNLLIGGANRFVSFDPASLKEAPPPPDVSIVSLRAMDSSILIETALRDKVPVTLSYKQNFISITFKSLQYHHPVKIRYFYQLEGVDENWVSTEDLLTAKYTNLPPGRYTFRVRAVNTVGTFSARITSLQLFIKPAFWQTTWFRLLILVITASLIYLYYRFRIAGIKREAKQREAIQQQMAQLEMRALRAQMNPHFIFNALNSIQTFMMKSETEQALSYLARFAKLIRNVLDNSQLNNIPVSKEVTMLENYLELEKLRFADQFEYHILIDPLLDADMVEIPTMIIQPFVENAIWHGLLYEERKGKLTITFRQVGHQLYCTVEDNGIGREKAAAMKRMVSHQSRGLQITRDRLALYNRRFNADAGFAIEDLTNEKGEPEGTRINLWFPLIGE
ncbi:ligand-binding sensor domain-containing protein [Chitinophaga nivalis]|uniref:Histidine kinase n=1 Tax=Chitinophaga nivalis TaxID=2991709 RepID=A0ABT3IWY0_9BACT|nr:sensor histidine kinase [Chitinophaga nivalis]MCW3461831.1 histidine kinase [Chitinophaga nivalis]MCW3488475.1 histidine kinase [Chitinophaga nivalis]